MNFMLSINKLLLYWLYDVQWHSEKKNKKKTYQVSCLSFWTKITRHTFASLKKTVFKGWENKGSEVLQTQFAFRVTFVRRESHQLKTVGCQSQKVCFLVMQIDSNIYWGLSWRP